MAAATLALYARPFSKSFLFLLVGLSLEGLTVGNWLDTEGGGTKDLRIKLLQDWIAVKVQRQTNFLGS